MRTIKMASLRKEELDREIHDLELYLERERLKFEVKRREAIEKQKQLRKEMMRMARGLLK